MGRLSFSIAINLLTDKFKNGTSRVKSGFREMQMHMLAFAAALGAGGIGLSNFITRMVETARETNRVNTALKNISGTMAEYISNQTYLIKLAKKYGLEINVLTGNFAKFSASANSAGMAMSDQRAIFDSVSRAITAFGLSSEDANLTFLAISQMISKGKISSEELRRQLGERLPVAMAAMAKAAGVSISQLDKLMKDGKLYSSEILPKFAKALNEMIPNVSTDNLETSINRLKNAFTEFTNNTGIQDAYKKLIDKLTELVTLAADNIKGIVAQLAAFITGVALARMFKWIATQLAIAQNQAMLAARKSAKVAGQSFDYVSWKATSATVTIRTAFTRMATAVRASMIRILPLAVFTLISSLIAKLYTMKQEANEIKKIFSSYRSEAAKIGLPEEAAKLQRMQQIANDTTNSYKVRSGAIKEINGLLGTNYSIDSKTLKINGDINSKISERVALLKSAAAVEFYQKRKLDSEAERRALIAKYGGGETGKRNLERANTLWSKKNRFGYKSFMESIGLAPSDYIDFQKYMQYQYIGNDAAKQLNFFEKNLLERGGSRPVIDEPSDKKTDLQKAEEEYAKSKKELTNQLANQAIKEEEYNKAIDDLNEATYKKIGGLLAPDQAQKNKTFLSAKDGYDNPLLPKEYRIINEYYKELGKLTDQFSESLINHEEYNSAELSLTAKTIENLLALENQTEASKLYADQLKKQRSDLAKNGEVLKKIRDRSNKDNRDTTFDYNLKDSEKIGAQISFEQNKLESLISAYNNGAVDLVNEIDKQLSHVTSLEDALKIAKVKEDVKDLGKSLNESIYSGVKDIASSANNLVYAWQQLTDIINDVDASGWEKFMAVWAALTNTADAILSTTKTIETLIKLSEKLAKAKDIESRIESEAANKALANAGKKVAADSIEAASATATATTEVGANTAIVTSNAAKDASSVPFGWLAIPGVIAGALAMMSAIPKFENGGVVGGNSFTGDKILARLNSGELVLNRAQQSGLYSLINSRQNAANNRLYGQVIVRGSDLRIALDNYDRTKRRV